MVKSEALDPRINTNPIIFLFLLGLCSPNSSYLLALSRGRETIIKLIYRGEGGNSNNTAVYCMAFN